MTPLAGGAGFPLGCRPFAATPKNESVEKIIIKVPQKIYLDLMVCKTVGTTLLVGSRAAVASLESLLA